MGGTNVKFDLPDNKSNNELSYNISLSYLKTLDDNISSYNKQEHEVNFSYASDVYGIDNTDNYIRNIMVAKKELLYSILDYLNIPVTDEDLKNLYIYKNEIQHKDSTDTNIITNETIAESLVRTQISTNYGLWLECIMKMGKWYQANVHTYWDKPPDYIDTKGIKKSANNYSPRAFYACSLIDNELVGDDCTAFISACLKLYAKSTGNSITIGDYGSSQFTENGAAGKVLKQLGFKYLQINGDLMYAKRIPEDVKPGAIICVNQVMNNTGKEHHGEIFWGKENGILKSYSWGSIHDGINGHQPMPAKYVCKHYVYCWQL